MTVPSRFFFFFFFFFCTRRLRIAVLFGATGMVGQGALRACLEDAGVARVLAVGRTPSGASNPKLLDLVRPDLTDYAGLEADLALDAVLLCLGVSSSGLDEAGCTRLTSDLTLAAATVLARLRPGIAFVASRCRPEQQRTRPRHVGAVKGARGSAAAAPASRRCMLHRESSSPCTASFQRRVAHFYDWTGPLLTVLRRVVPRWVLTTDGMGRAMLAVAPTGAPEPCWRCATSMP